MRIPADTEVTWTSQGRGNITEKKGKVIGFLPAYVSAVKRHGFLDSIKRSRIQFDNIRLPSILDRYLIEVQRVGKKGQPLPSWYYAPNAKAIEKANPKACEVKP